METDLEARLHVRGNVGVLVEECNLVQALVDRGHHGGWCLCHPAQGQQIPRMSPVCGEQGGDHQNVRRRERRSRAPAGVAAVSRIARRLPRRSPAVDCMSSSERLPERAPHPERRG